MARFHCKHIFHQTTWEYIHNNKLMHLVNLVQSGVARVGISEAGINGTTVGTAARELICKWSESPFVCISERCNSICLYNHDQFPVACLK